jgi:chemotaxis protein methyltransferase CheR
LNARQVFYEGGAGTTILRGMQDVTERRNLEREKDDLLRQKDALLEELQHRIANSLQIIASIILMKARAVQSEETRFHLEDAHKQARIVDRCRAETASCIGSRRSNRNRTLSVKVV